MIVVTRLNDTQFAVNPDLIERIHASPDTTLVMVDGAKFIVTESMAEVIEKIAAYRARVISLAHDLPASGPRPLAAPQLGLVAPVGAGGADAPHQEARAVPLRARKK
ncbi:flagellar FlbD family protein [Leifsonia sp. AG29]|uniref:flagellar FlbD family protein n=1 Tax=Leifsonia sp. AG29 TaxID=2598860 RepID=UPI00131C04B9|nr:flagellar FlbD family protein [Leifsonia sp. AG29]